MSRIKQLQEIKEEAENLANSIGDLLLSFEDKSEEVKKYTLEEVRACLSDKSRLGFTKDIKQILKKYNANKLSEIKEQDYESVVLEVKELKK